MPAPKSTDATAAATTTPAGTSGETKAASAANPFANLKVTAKNFVPAVKTASD